MALSHPYIRPSNFEDSDFAQYIVPDEVQIATAIVLTAGTDLIGSHGIDSIVTAATGLTGNIITDSAATNTASRVMHLQVNGNQPVPPFPYGDAGELALSEVADGVIFQSYHAAVMDCRLHDIRGSAVQATYASRNSIEQCWTGIESFPDGWYLGNEVYDCRDYGLHNYHGSVKSTMNHYYGMQKAVYMTGTADAFVSVNDQMADALLAGFHHEATGRAILIGTVFIHDVTHSARCESYTEIISPYCYVPLSHTEWPNINGITINYRDCSVIGGFMAVDAWQNPGGTGPFTASHAGIEILGTGGDTPYRAQVDTYINAAGAKNDATGVLVTDPLPCGRIRLRTDAGFETSGSALVRVAAGAADSYGTTIEVIGTEAKTPVSLPANFNATNIVHRVNMDSGERMRIWPTTVRPVCLFKMDQASGNEVDSSTGGGTLTDTNTVTSAIGLLHPTSRYFTRASTEYFTAASTDNYKVLAGEKLTIAAWVKLATNSNLMFIVSKDDVGTNREYALYYDTSSNRFIFETFRTISGGTPISVSSLTAPTVGVWHLVIAQMDGIRCRLNVDDGRAAISNSQQTAIYPGVAAFQIGARAGTSTWDGQIGPVKIWKRGFCRDDQMALWDAAWAR